MPAVADADTTTGQTLKIQVAASVARRLTEIGKRHGLTREQAAVLVLEQELDRRDALDETPERLPPELDERFDPDRPTQSVETTFANVRRKVRELIAAHEADGDGRPDE